MDDNTKQEVLEMPLESLKDIGFSGTKKPVLTKFTEATVTDVRLNMRQKEEVTTDGSGKFKQAFIAVDFKFAQPIGDVESVTENYSFKIFDNNGKYNASLGSKSQTGLLKDLICETFGVSKDASVTELFNTLKGKRVFLLTVQTSYQGETFNKLAIKQFKL